MADETGGEYLPAGAMAVPLLELKRARLDPMTKRVFDTGEETVAKTRYQWVLLPALILILLEILTAGGRRR